MQCLGLVLLLLPLIGLLCLVVGVVSLAASAKQRSLKSHEWHGTPGVVLSAEVREDVSSDSVDGIAGSVSYCPRVTYEYMAHGQTYTGDQISLAGSAHTRESASAVVSRYPPGLAVTVRVSPADPKLAILDPRPVALDFGFLWLAAICFAVWLLALAGVAVFHYYSR